MNIYNKPVLNFTTRNLSKGARRFKNKSAAKDNIKFQNQAFSPNKSPTQMGRTAVTGVTDVDASPKADNSIFKPGASAMTGMAAGRLPEDGVSGIELPNVQTHEL